MSTTDDAPLTMSPSTSRRYRVGVIEGDGIGPEITRATLEVLDAAVAGLEQSPFEYVRLPIGYGAIEEYGVAVPDHVFEALDASDGWIMGPHDSAGYPPPHNAVLNPSGTVRKRFDLYANIRPAKLFGSTSRYADEGDLVIVRENTQGFYADRNTFEGTGEWMPSPDVAIAQGVFTRPAIERIARVACELAMQRDRHLTIVHKANVLRLTTGFFRDICREVASGYPELTVDDFHIDAMTVHVLRRPGDFDVIVTENMFGDILSDLAGEVCGSLGIASSLNAGDRLAMAQAAHGSAPDIAGQNVANPTSLILSTTLYLRWLAGRHGDDALLSIADRIDAAVEQAITSGQSTRDLGGTLGTREFGAVVGKLLAP
jgi:3-isopropylmalate dehydrogenase